MTDRPTSYDGRSLPEGWVLWSDEDGLVVCYRPDVFDGESYPRPCLPTMTVSEADVGTVGGREGWRVTFYVEADVPARGLESVFVDYDEAIDYVVETGQRFVEGDLDLRGFYADGDVREEYVQRLENMTSD